MIKNWVVLFGLIIFGLETHGMDDSDFEEDWFFLEIAKIKEVTIFNKMRDFFSKQDSSASPNVIPLKPAPNLPDDIILSICSFMLKDWRDIFAFFRTNQHYHKMGKNTIENTKYKLETLELEFISRLRTNLILFRMIENPSAYPKLTTLNLRGCGIGDAKKYSLYSSNQKKWIPGEQLFRTFQN